MNSYTNKSINGEVLKQFYGDTGYIALAQKVNNNYSYDIHQGLNEKEMDDGYFGNISGGLEFIKEDEFYKMIIRVSEYDCYWTLDISDDAEIYIEENNFLTNEFNALEIKDLKDLPCWKNKDICLKAVQQCGKLLKYADVDENKDTMKEIYKAAVEQDERALKFVPLKIQQMK